MFTFCKSDDEREKQAKLLAKAIKKACEPKKCYNDSAAWRKLAHDLATDVNVSTKYVPVKNIIKIFQNGNLDLAVALYDGNREDPIFHRAKNLITTLLHICPKDDEDFRQVADTINWLEILMHVATAKCIYIKSGALVAKNYLYQEASARDGVEPEDLMEIPKIIKFIAKSELKSPIDVETILPYCIKIFKPISTNPYSQDTYNLKDLTQRFPVDIVKDFWGNLSMSRTLGINERVDLSLLELAYGHRVEWTKQISNLDDTISQSQMQNLDDLSKEDLRHYIEFKKIWQLKAEGVKLEHILAHLDQEGCVLTAKSIKLAYEMHPQSSVIYDLDEPDEFMDSISPDDANVTGQS